ncbi:MAG TPA: hypothetical protein VKN18_13445 [Blastocatellia bacterium]|nr:hypothetical protein [Blastocatellia bacterium]
MKESLAQAGRKLIGPAVVALSVLAFCAANSADGHSKKRNTGQVVTLRDIDQLKEAFQRDAGKVRFITILSPT